jgi:hypothetical protein
MPTAIFDASLLTYRKRAGVLSHYYTNVVSVGGSFPTARTEQPREPLAEVILARRQGGCTDCGNTSGGNPGIGPCGCTR